MDNDEQHFDQEELQEGFVEKDDHGDDVVEAEVVDDLDLTEEEQDRHKGIFGDDPELEAYMLGEEEVF